MSEELARPTIPRSIIAGVAHAARGMCAYAAVAMWDVEQRKVLAYSVGRENRPLPYYPGRLAYAVSPAITVALLRLVDDFVMHALIVHGHGRSHPRRFGVACHVGMLHQTKTVGVAERLLVGAHAKVPPARGAWEPVVHEGCVIGAAVRTRPDAKIVYVSPGWGCELEEAIDLVMAATVRYRWPEPLRYARMQLKTAIRRRLELHKHA